MHLRPVEGVLEAGLEARDAIDDGVVRMLAQLQQLVLPQRHPAVVDHHEALEANLQDAQTTVTVLHTGACSDMHAVIGIPWMSRQLSKSLPVGSMAHQIEMILFVCS